MAMTKDITGLDLSSRFRWIQGLFFLFFFKFYLFLSYVYGWVFDYVCLCTTWVWYLWKPEEGDRSLGWVGIENQLRSSGRTQVLNPSHPSSRRLILEVQVCCYWSKSEFRHCPGAGQFVIPLAVVSQQDQRQYLVRSHSRAVLQGSGAKHRWVGTIMGWLTCTY